MMKLSMLVKGLLSTAIVIGSVSSLQAADDKRLAKVQKELRIMSKIFETAITDQNRNKNAFLSARQSESTYLANQGMVFSFSFGRNSFASVDEWAAFGEGVGQFVGEIASEVGQALAEAPLAPEVSVDFEEYFNQYQDLKEEHEIARQRLAEQREQVREMQREIRRMEGIHEREAEKSEMEKLQKNLEQKMEELERKKEEYRKQMEDYRNRRDEKFITNAKQKSDTILATLCDYGATLRSLDDKEHVTLIFKNYTDNKDQIYVFDASTIQSCESSKQLISKAIAYQME